MTATARVDVLGVEVSVVDLARTVEQIGEWIEARASHYVCVTGVHGVMESQRDPELKAVHNGSGLTVPDGRPMVWAGRFAGAADLDQVRGFDLVQAVSAEAATRAWRCFFYGGADGVAARAVERLVAAHPGLEVVGVYVPPFRRLTDEEDDAVVAQINEARPDIVWVGLSCPKQERWMAEHVGRIEAPVLIGVGAAFDMHAGLVRTAPRWMQRLGFEWVYRMAQEPRRLAGRYLRSNPAFLLRIARRRPRLLTVEPRGS